MRRGEQVPQVARIVREVGVHLDHELRAARERAGEAGQVGVAEARLGGRGGAPRPIGARGELVGDPPVPSGELSSTTRIR